MCRHEAGMSMHMPHDLARINNVTRNTGIHTFHIIGIYPWSNMPVTVTLHIYVPPHSSCSLHINLALVHTLLTKTWKYNFYLTCYCHIFHSNRCSTQILHICHMFKLIHMQIWGKYANICTSYEFPTTMWPGVLVHILQITVIYP